MTGVEAVAGMEIHEEEEGEAVPAATSRSTIAEDHDYDDPLLPDDMDYPMDAEIEGYEKHRRQ